MSILEAVLDFGSVVKLGNEWLKSTNLKWDRSSESSKVNKSNLHKFKIHLRISKFRKNLNYNIDHDIAKFKLNRSIFKVTFLRGKITLIGGLSYFEEKE